MRTELAGKAVLVTGGASGIGLACVRAFREEGARVGVIDRTPGDGVEVADVTDDAALASAVATVAGRLGGLDVVVACAGISGPVGKPVAETTAAEVAAVLAVNVTGQFLLVKHALPHLGDGGAVVLLGSDSAFTAAPGMVPYCASKGAVVAMTRALAVEVPGIRVNCVCPSVVDTPMARGDLGDVLDDPAFPVQQAADVARQVLYLASPASRPVNGQALLADFGMSARSAFPA
ncbi:SDR family oxidoreductase [Amycolatopsis sp. OK19-0408]|uniref:SDR family oxidoreductase n=1 Tax=Amycolatopsis iheyensis TaxID=2945988 RepID=A0A9X2N7Y0_9PSEU|nr:SDR family oxidoreductase [Amycolatopsis iheyensis]MCR6482537.1 SDR family oxidoreductase [Amycolatopsis iheyensis]